MIKVKDGYAKLVGTTYLGSANHLLRSNGGVWEVHTGRNNEANKIVRTDGSGYLQTGWISTTSGDMGTTSINRVYCSNDSYIRYKTPANFFSSLTNSGDNLSITIASQNRTLTVLYARIADLLRSKGTIAPQTGRTLNLGDVYSYHLSASVSGGPTTNAAVIGFGRGTSGTVEIAGEWTGGRGLWVRALRNTTDNWYAWDKVLTQATYTGITDSRYYTKTLADNRYVNVTGDTMTGNLSISETKNILLRPNLASYHSGIGYDTSGNECIALWAKNTVTRLRWHAGLDLTNLSSGSMMSITPDFEISKASGIATGYIGGKVILHSGNYNSYSPTLTGSGASGTWGINITGTSSYTKIVNVIDIRDTNPTPNDKTPGATAKFWFNDTGTPDGNWWSGITVNGWSKNYGVWELCSNSTTSAVNQRPYFRNGLGTTWSSWKAIAFLTDNVASATKLQTARTIWGQSFDGKKDITGPFSYAQVRIHNNNEINSTTDSSGLWLGYRDTKKVVVGNDNSCFLEVKGKAEATTFVKKGSSNNYLLLGGGGHKAISDFSVKNHNHNSLYVTALGTSGNYVTWTKNGATNNLTVPYAERARQLSSYGQSPNNSHPGYGARIFYSWNIGQANNATTGYSNGITIGSNPGDTAYGFLIVQNMWDDRTYTRRYNSGWQTWKTLAWTSDILNPADYYWANIRISTSPSTGTSPTFSTAYTSNWFRSTGNTGWYSETYGGGWYMSDSTWIRTFGNKSVYQDTGLIRTDGYLVTNGGLTAGATSPNNGTYKLHVTGASWSSGLIRAGGGFYHDSVNSNSYVLLAGGSYKGLGDFAKGNAGSATKGVYVTRGTVTAMTYYLNANVNAGTSGKLAYYSGANTLSSYTSTVGSPALPIYLNVGFPSASLYSFTGTYSNPVIVWCGEISRSSPSSTYWYSTKKGGCCNISFTTNNADSNGNLVISIPNCEPYAAFCSTVEIFHNYTLLSAATDGTVNGRSAGMGDYMTLCNVSGTTGSVHIKKFGLRDKNNDAWTNGELKRTKTSDDNRPVARFYLTIVGRYI